MSLLAPGVTEYTWPLEMYDIFIVLMIVKTPRYLTLKPPNTFLKITFMLHEV